MNKLVFKAILLALPFAFILIYVEHRLRQIPSSYLNNKTEIEKRQNEIEILITGASHAASALPPQFMSRPTFNMASSSQTIYYDTQLVTKYAAAMPKLKLVILTISYHALESQLKNSMERWRGGFYKQVYGIPREDEGEGFQFADYSYIGLYTPKLAYKMVLEDLFQADKLTAEAGDAGVKINFLNDVSLESAKKRVKLHETEMRESSVAANVEFLERVCRLLQEKNIAVVFVTVPAHRTYYDTIQPEKYQRMQQTIKQLSEKYKIEYFNYLSDSRIEDRDFLNSDHLNLAGSERFSKIVEQEIIQKYVKDN